MTEQVQHKEKNKFSVSKIIIPIAIGLGVVGWMFYKEFDPGVFGAVDFTWVSVFWIFVAVLCMVGRDFGYMLRIRVLSENFLSWKQAFRVIMLWEFTSAVTPSAIGGTSVALMYVHKEGLSVGRSSTIVMLTSLLDELYFVLMFPIIWLIVGSRLFDIPNDPEWSFGIFLMVIIAYGIKLVWVLTLSYGLFFNPRGLSKLIYRIFHLPILRRWKRSAAKAASDITITAGEIKQKKFKFWRNAFLSTFLSWSSRYLVVNALILAFFTTGDHLLLFARQLVMWIAMLIMPTPGGSGFAEWGFTKFLGEFIPVAGFAIVLAFLWRLITYYPYLVIGVVMLPKWLGDNFGKGKKKKHAKI